MLRDYIKCSEKVFEALDKQNVYLGGILLKPNMVISAKCEKQASVDEVSTMTLNCLNENVPKEVPGIVFCQVVKVTNWQRNI